MTGRDGAKPGAGRTREDREARLKDALRANLRRRKAQARDRAGQNDNQETAADDRGPGTEQDG